MLTAVKVDEEAKSRLEELQAEIKLRTGEKVTQQELLTRLIDDAYESREAIIDSFRESTVPLSEGKKRRCKRVGSAPASRRTKTTSTTSSTDDSTHRYGRGIRRPRD